MHPTYIAKRDKIKPVTIVQWSKLTSKGKMITNANNIMKIPNGPTLSVQHIKFSKKSPKGQNRIRHIVSTLKYWRKSNFSHNDHLLFTENLTTKDGPIIIHFDPPIHAAGANIQTDTPGNFHGVLRVICTDGTRTTFERPGVSEESEGTALFLGASSCQQNIQQLEFSTTDIEEKNHASFDKKGFAINHLSITI